MLWALQEPATDKYHWQTDCSEEDEPADPLLRNDVLSGKEIGCLQECPHERRVNNHGPDDTARLRLFE